MDARQAARALAHRLVALGGGADVRRLAAGRTFAALDPLDTTALVDALVRLAREGEAAARGALAPVLEALPRDAHALPGPEQLKRVAALQELERVAALFPEGPARQELDAGVARKRDAALMTESLGHLKQKARTTRDPDVLARIATASHPDVVRNALLNPRLTEAWVVRMAARRPARPEPLVEIWRSPRWGGRPAVRKALAFNPYLPPEVGTKLVPLLPHADLEELARDGSVHPALRAQAQGLLAAGDAG